MGSIWLSLQVIKELTCGVYLAKFAGNQGANDVDVYQKHVAFSKHNNVEPVKHKDILEDISKDICLSKILEKVFPKTVIKLIISISIQSWKTR